MTEPKAAPPASMRFTSAREPTGDERVEREQWQEVEKMYDRAHDAVHAAGVAVHYAGNLVSRLLRDRRPL